MWHFVYFYNVTYHWSLKDYLGMSPLLSVGKEHVAVDDVVQVVAEEVREVVEVLDANVLQKFKIANEDGRTGSLINNPKSISHCFSTFFKSRNLSNIYNHLAEPNRSI